MRCNQCGSLVHEGKLICSRCGADIQIVPDYNPLDDVLTAQVRGSIDGSEAPLDNYQYRTNRRANTARDAVNSNTAQRDRRQSVQKKQLTPEERKRRIAKKKAMQRKKRIRFAMICTIFLIVVGIVVAVVLSQTSYSAQIKKGREALNAKNYTEAEYRFTKAIDKKPKKADAYKGMADTLIAQGEEDKAEELVLDAIDKYSDCSDIYEAAFYVYKEIGKAGEIPVLIDSASDSVVNKLSAYTVKKPSFSFDKETYDDVQQLTLESKDNTVYYTTDGSDPCYSDTRIQYTEPIQITEGENTIKAVAFNKNDIPSLTVSKTYTVELPVEDAPAVSPSTGQYDSYTEISIVVPDGYTAYYTLDGSEPSVSSILYEGPIDMPEGSTIFKAVLVNGSGRMSGVTTRNYELTY